MRRFTTITGAWLVLSLGVPPALAADPLPDVTALRKAIDASVATPEQRAAPLGDLLQPPQSGPSPILEALCESGRIVDVPGDVGEKRATAYVRLRMDGTMLVDGVPGTLEFNGDGWGDTILVRLRAPGANKNQALCFQAAPNSTYDLAADEKLTAALGDGVAATLEVWSRGEKRQLEAERERARNALEEGYVQVVARELAAAWLMPDAEPRSALNDFLTAARDLVTVSQKWRDAARLAAGGDANAVNAANQSHERLDEQAATFYAKRKAVVDALEALSGSAANPNARSLDARYAEGARLAAETLKAGLPVTPYTTTLSEQAYAAWLRSYEEGHCAKAPAEGVCKAVHELASPKRLKEIEAARLTWLRAHLDAPAAPWRVFTGQIPVRHGGTVVSLRPGVSPVDDRIVVAPLKPATFFAYELERDQAMGVFKGQALVVDTGLGKQLAQLLEVGLGLPPLPRLAVPKVSEGAEKSGDDCNVTMTRQLRLCLQDAMCDAFAHLPLDTQARQLAGVKQALTTANGQSCKKVKAGFAALLDELTKRAATVLAALPDVPASARFSSRVNHRTLEPGFEHHLRICRGEKCDGETKTADILGERKVSARARYPVLSTVTELGLNLDFGRPRSWFQPPRSYAYQDMGIEGGPDAFYKLEQPASVLDHFTVSQLLVWYPGAICDYIGCSLDDVLRRVGIGAGPTIFQGDQLELRQLNFRALYHFKNAPGVVALAGFSLRQYQVPAAGRAGTVIAVPRDSSAPGFTARDELAWLVNVGIGIDAFIAVDAGSSLMDTVLGEGDDK